MMSAQEIVYVVVASIIYIDMIVAGIIVTEKAPLYTGHWQRLGGMILVCGSTFFALGAFRLFDALW